MNPESISDLEKIKSKTRPGQNVVFVSGNFNVVHPGHLRLLKFAADCGDLLVVGVNNQQKKGAIVSEKLRLENVLAIGMVDYAFVLRDTEENFIKALCPAIVVKGKEHESQFNSEQSAVNTYGGNLLFCSGEIVFSSLDLLRHELSEVKISNIIEQPQYMDRHGLR